LPLCGIWKGVPLFWWGPGSIWEGSSITHHGPKIRGKNAYSLDSTNGQIPHQLSTPIFQCRNLPWPVNSVRLHNVSNEGCHGDTSVLDFCLAQEANGCVVRLTPDGDSGQFKWIVVLSLKDFRKCKH
jgi:hypothetical protein